MKGDLVTHRGVVKRLADGYLVVTNSNGKLTLISTVKLSFGINRFDGKEVTVTIEEVGTMEEKRIRELERRPFAKVFPKAITAIREGKCPVCGNGITGFRDDSSRKEHMISGLCQVCQDAAFNPSKET